jgi:hypothetical protein
MCYVLNEKDVALQVGGDKADTILFGLKQDRPT